MKNLTLAVVIASFILFTSCGAYQVSTISLSEQLSGNTVDKGYFIAATAVKGNDLEKIKCIDKDGKEIIINVTDRTGVRITKIDNSKTSFYFNTLIIKDNAITGSKTHFANIQIKPIKLADISKIEIMR